jgi:deazaflavin-dependent oxidoreductase (nitroreductase family)
VTARFDATNWAAGIVDREMPTRNEAIIDEFRSRQGRVGGPFEGRTLLLLHHRGAKTGTEWVNPVAYQRLSPNSVAVFASKGGSPENPDWYYNLVANPDASVEIGTEAFPVQARVAAGEERERIWDRQKREWPGFADYEEKTKGIREIPVVVLDRT